MLHFYFDMDGTLCEWKPCKDLSVLYRPGYFVGLKKQEHVVTLLCDLLDAGYPCTVLSAVLGEQQESEKRIWLGRVFGDRRPEIPAIFVPNGSNKSHYVSATEETVLLDDHSPNLTKWYSAGGTGIKVLNGFNGSGKNWQGPRVDARGKISVEEVLRFARTRESEVSYPVTATVPFASY
ncbi:MAG: hypothetical protein IJL03_07250 [Lachnospiraceae bacterium]|nr:hypothetical protein [Lachnospiraceae bacterium]